MIRSAPHAQPPGTEKSTDALLTRAEAINAHIRARAPMMVPSALWTVLSQSHQALLREHGIESFKRGLSQSYSTFMVRRIRHAHFRAALRNFMQHPSTAPFRTKFGAKSAVRNAHGRDRLSTDLSWRIYGMYVSLLWSYVRSGRDDLAERLSEPLLGDPIPIRFDGHPISQDLATSIHEYRTLRPHLPSRGVLAEIGAGYGRLGHVAHAADNVRYWVFDISPALTVSEWYLSSLFPDRKIFRWRPFERWDEVADEVEESDFAFFSADQLALVPRGAVDVFAAISCLHEMTSEQADFQMAHMAEKGGTALYTKNWTEWHNAHDGVTFRSSDLTAPPGWRTVLDRTDAIWPKFTEKLFTRAAPLR